MKHQRQDRMNRPGWCKHLVVLALALACAPREGEWPAPERPVLGTAEQPVSMQFAAGSLVIPMDTTYQNNGMLRAYGLVYRLLAQGVPVHWAVLTGKALGAADFTASGTDLQTGQVITDHGYRGGPFVISASDRDRALPIINGWHAAGNVTTVHSMTTSFTADIRRTLVAAPKIAVFADGNELIAFTNLNAAGIPDSLGQPWPTSVDRTRNYPSHPDVLNATEIKGPTIGGSPDGALIRSDGTSPYCHITSMHYSLPAEDEVVREVRAWLNLGPTTHAYMQCFAVEVFENSASGKLITTAGLRDDGDAPTQVAVRVPDDPLSQLDGSLVVDTGTTDSIGLAPGSAFRPNTRVLINAAAYPENQRMVWISGYLDGNPAKGRVTYLAGHKYSTSLPVTNNPKTNGVRLFLNSLFESPCANELGQPALTLTKSAPAVTNGSTITFTLSVSNSGPGTADSSILRDAIPPGTTFVSATGNGSFAGGVVTWTLGNLPPGYSGSQSFTVSVASDGTYANQAELSYRVGNTPKVITSNTTSTVRDTVPPVTTIGSGPSSPTSATTATFAFSANEEGVAFECRLDSGTFAACSSPLTLSGLTDGSHTFEVRARDRAGNLESPPASWTWTVDTVAPNTFIVSGPPPFTREGSATFDFSSDEANVSYQCRLDDAAWIACTDPSTFVGLAQGNHRLEVRAGDLAGNWDPTPAVHRWTVDSTPPETSITSGPPPLGNATSATFAFSSNEAGVTFECQIDAGGFSDCLSPVTYSGLAEGSHQFRVRARDPAGNVDPTPAEYAWVIDLTVPAPPVILTPQDGSYQNTRTVVVSGTVEAFARVRVFLDLSAAGTTVADERGQWSLTLGNVGDQPAPHRLNAQAEDQAGNVSGLSPPTFFTVDTVPPPAPILLQPPDGLVTSNPRPAISGTAEALAMVIVYLNETPAGTVQASSSGAWSFTPTSGLPDGTYRVQAQARDLAQNLSELSEARSFTVDTVPPGQPTVLSPSPGEHTNDPTPLITGTAEAGSGVEIKVDDVVVVVVQADPQGGFSHSLVTPLADGGHNVVVTARDSAGNASVPAGPIPFVVDTVAPLPPVIDLPAQDATLNTRTPTVSGRAEPGTSVRVFSGSRHLGTVTANETSGAWSYTLSEDQALGEGRQTLHADARDRAGNTSPPSPDRSFFVDVTSPPVPVISYPPPGAWIRISSPTITGTAESLARIDLLVDGSFAGSADADSNGQWSFTTAFLADGTHRVSARATDRAGNQSAFSEERFFVIDTRQPAAPVVVRPANGSFTNDSTPEVSGTAEPWATIQIFVDGAAVTTATVGVDGTWTATISDALSDGPHSLSVTATDQAGNTGPPSLPVSFTVDTSPPDPPVITYPENGSRIRQPQPTIIGTSMELGVTVRVWIDGVLRGEALVVGSGVWSVPLTSDLTNGPHEVTAVAYDLAQNQSAPSTVSFTVDLLPPGQPRIDSPRNGEFLNDATPTLSGLADPNTTVEVYRNGDLVDHVTSNGAGQWSFTFPEPGLAEGSHVFTVRAVDDAGNPGPFSDPVQVVLDLTPPDAPTILTPAPDSRIGTATPTLSGTATPGDRVDVWIRDTPVAAVVVADASGRWRYSLTPAQALSEGPHTVMARARDAAGNVSSTTSSSFFVDLTAPDAPVITSPANGSYVSERQPTVTGTAEAGSTVTVMLDGRVLGTVVAGSDGAWSYRLTESQALPDGSFVLRAYAGDMAGNVGALSAPVSFTVDLEPPTAPVIVAPAQGAAVSSRRPLLQGTAEPGAQVAISLDGQAPFTVQADLAGVWSFTPPEDLAEGAHRAVAVAVDRAGNASPPSPERIFTVDSIGPEPPIILSPIANARLNDSTPTVSGIAEPGSQVTVMMDGSPRGEVVASASGEWSYTLTPGQALQDGTHLVTAVARDAAGNASRPADPVSFSVDTQPPRVPQVLVPTDGTITSNPTPTISGSSEVGTAVQIFIDGQLVGTAPVDTAGVFQLVPSGALPDGVHTVTARAVDDHQNVSGSSPAISMVIDTTPPAPPVVLSPAHQSRSNNSTPTVTGTTEPGARVEIFIDGQLVATVVSDGNGRWRYTLTVSQALPDGTHSVTARATDLAGNVGALSAPNEFTIDTMIPATPVITRPTDGARLNTATPTIAGTAELGVRVLVMVDGRQVGIVPVAAGGTWAYSLMPAQALAEGPHQATARAFDLAGNQSGLAAPVAFVVDTVAPLPPNVLVPAADTTLPTQTPAISGTAEPGAQVEIFVDGVFYGSTRAGSDGSWSYQPSQDQALSEGTHVVTAQARDGAGNVSPSSAEVTVIIDVTPPASPVVILPADGSSVSDPTPLIVGTSEPGAEVEVLLDGVPVGRTRADALGAWTLEAPNPLADGEHAVAARAWDAAGNVGPLSAANRFVVDTVAPSAPTLTAPPPLTNDPTPTISGTAEPGSTVKVYLDDDLVGEVTVGPDGSWSLDPTVPVGDGDHTVTVVAVDASGNPSVPVHTSVTVDTTPPDPPFIREPVDRGVYLEPPAARGTATPGVRVRLSLDGVDLPEVWSGGDGGWGMDLANLLPGEHTLVAVAIDEAGNVSQPSNRVVFRFRFGELLDVSGGGCTCSVSDSVPSLGWLGIVAAAAVLLWRRRREAS
jgi:uncharacterized repeat protein (TIGR01451 family)/MYXO-CTERM domain-containing protein